MNWYLVLVIPSVYFYASHSVVTWEVKSKVKVDTKRILQCSLCADASFLYIHNQMQGLVKIGTSLTLEASVLLIWFGLFGLV
jgi:hypothetical protein